MVFKVRQTAQPQSSEGEIKAMLGPKPSAKARVEDQLLYWIARAKVAEGELERRYYEWLDG